MILWIVLIGIVIVIFNQGQAHKTRCSHEDRELQYEIDRALAEHGLWQSPREREAKRKAVQQQPAKPLWSERDKQNVVLAGAAIVLCAGVTILCLFAFL